MATTLNELKGNVKRFAETCRFLPLNQLRLANVSEANLHDCQLWGISEEQWHVAVGAALTEKEAQRNE